MINKSRKDSPECGDKPIAGEFAVLGEGDLKCLVSGGSQVCSV